MGTQNPQPGQDETKPETHRLLTAAEYFLSQRHFADCRRYALRARDSDPTHPGSTRILSVASVLSVPKNISSTTRPDYYAILNLPQFESDAARIRSSFKSLAAILNPNVNPYPLAAEALDVVLKAWSVLSNPNEKATFDEELRRNLNLPGGGGGGSSGSDGGTFWTMCPYCYCVHEYVKAYEDCCLRCANERCRRVLHAVAIGAPPPPDVVEKGYYWCAGFMPFAICNSNGEEIGEKLWAPFAPPIGSASKGGDHNFACGGEGLVVDISDDERAGAENAETVENGFQGHGNGKRTKIGAEASNSSEIKDANGEIPKSRGGIENGFMENSVKEMRTRRKKSVPLNSKKLMGRGFIIDSNQAHSIYGVGEDGPLNVNGNQGDVWEHGFGGEVSNGVESGVEFFEGDDDVLIGLQCDFDLGNGDL
ncbi:hypothetical protein DH2020_013815 [Rehmannia glutinosa]|uniref:J domain-containing protein n=1 Tax=Rehmannia glutinosa TaxID=99300 RepID=A0ABR0X3G2_REHGL